MPRPLRFKATCEPIDTLVDLSRSERAIPPIYQRLRRSTANLAKDGSLEDLKRYTAGMGVLQKAGFLRSLTFFTTPFNADDLQANIRPLANEAGKRVMDTSLRPAISRMQLNVNAYAGEQAKAHRLINRGEKSRASGDVLHAAFNFVPVERLRPVYSRVARTATEINQRAEDFRAAIITHIDEGISEMNKADITSYGYRDLAEFTHDIKEGITGLSKAQLNAAADVYGYMIDRGEASIQAAISSWKRSHPGSLLTDTQIMEELGIGPTLTSYVSHVMENSWRTGHFDYLLEVAKASGTIPFTSMGPKVTVDHEPFVEALRGIAGATRETPFRTASGKLAETPAAAFSMVFPGIKDPIAIQSHLSAITRAVKSSDAGGTWLAISPRLKNPYLIERVGIQGFLTDFWQVADAYTQAANRAIHLDPLFAPGGSMEVFLKDLDLADPVMGQLFGDHVRSIIGLSPLNDAAMRELRSVSAGLAGLVYSSISRMNLGLAVPNMLSPVLYGFPEAVRDGWVNGVKDFLTAATLTRDPAFRRILAASEISNTYTVGSEEKLHHMVARLWAAWEEGDHHAAARAAWESFSTYSEFLSLTERSFVRPLGSALGVARFLRRNNLTPEMLGRLDAAALDSLQLEMVNTVGKMTILGATTNAVPIVRAIRNLPGIGPLASMFTSTPLTFGASLFTNAKVMMLGPADMRGQAARIFMAQVAAGTLVAGPFWFYPWLREVQKLPGFDEDDTDVIIGALQAAEEWGSLAGWMGTDLARRLSPTAGVFDRFLPERGVAAAALGPAGGAATDILSLVTGDEAARRRLAGGFAPFLFDLPPSGIIPSPLQIGLPLGGVALEKFLRVSFATATDPRGYVTMGPFGVPVKNPSGYRLDVYGRPYGTSTPGGELRRFALGGRDIKDAIAAAEGKRGEKRTEARDVVEAKLRRAILEGRLTDMADIYSENASLRPTITLQELEQESVMRALPPQARAVYTGELIEVLPRVRQAAARLAAGGLSPSQEREEKMIYAMGVMKVVNSQPKRNVVLGQ